MPVVNRIAEFSGDMTRWRQHLHSIPELGQDCHDTAAFVTARLREFGVVIKVWPFDPASMQLRLEDLAPLMGPRTKLVCVHHVSTSN